MLRMFDMFDEMGNHLGYMLLTGSNVDAIDDRDEVTKCLISPLNPIDLWVSGMISDIPTDG